MVAFKHIINEVIKKTTLNLIRKTKSSLKFHFHFFELKVLWLTMSPRTFTKRYRIPSRLVHQQVDELK